MKAALISPNEPVFDYSDPPVQIGERVAEVADAEFPIAPPLFWVNCADDVVADQFYYDPATQQILAKQTPPLPPEATLNTTVIPNGPTVIS